MQAARPSPVRKAGFWQILLQKLLVTQRNAEYLIYYQKLPTDFGMIVSAGIAPQSTTQSTRRTTFQQVEQNRRLAELRVCSGCGCNLPAFEH